MKKVIIKELKLTNFKGIKSLQIYFDNQTNIFGANGTGKTTVFDAFTWLLFGKDSQERANFEIKTLDKDNNVIEKIEHEVEAVLQVDGKSFSVKRTLKEKWVTRRGSSESVFSGNETLYHWNDVPVQAADFANKVSQIVNEKVFKLITSPTAFNALKWQDQREVLISICGNITDEDIAKYNDDYQQLIEKANAKDVSIEDLEKIAKASLKKAKSEIKSIPTRIDEVQRNMPQALDFDVLESELKDLQAKKESVDNQITDKTAAQQEILNNKKDLQDQIYQIEKSFTDKTHELKQEARRLYLDYNAKPQELQSKLNSLNNEIKTREGEIKSFKNRVEHGNSHVHKLNRAMDDLRSEWEKRNAETFTMDDDECKCPTCKRELDPEHIEDKKKEMEQMFADKKRTDLNLINFQCQNLKAGKEQAEQAISSFKKRIADEEKTLDQNWIDYTEVSNQLKDFEGNTKTEADFLGDLNEKNQEFFNDLNDKLKEFKSKLADEPVIDVSELKDQRFELQKQIDQVKEQLHVKSQIAAGNQRIEKLKEEEESLASSIALLEKEIFTIEQFNKAKMDALESGINARFRFVNFKLFETQINGGETPTCKALIDGVPFSDANTASKINAGIDIINTLCEHYEVSAPVFIDNRESVTELIQCESQIVNLIVSPKHKTLSIESGSESLVNY